MGQPRPEDHDGQAPAERSSQRRTFPATVACFPMTGRCLDSNGCFSRSDLHQMSKNHTITSMKQQRHEVPPRVNNHNRQYPGEEEELRGNASSVVDEARMMQLKKNDALARIDALYALFDQGFLEQEEMNRRKQVILNQLLSPPSPGSEQYAAAAPFPTAYLDTPTQTTFDDFGHWPRETTESFFSTPERVQYPPWSSTCGALNPPPPPPPHRELLSQPTSHPPIFLHTLTERAIRHTFDVERRQWTSDAIWIKLDEQPFAKGSLRIVYHAQMMMCEHEEYALTNHYVAKLAINANENPLTYFKDIELQAHCRSYAQLYNEHLPPKKVEFVDAWVVELVDRKPGMLCGVERYIDGVYQKHNNNYGCVSEDERNTPQAFSHFTYEASKHQLLAVDIQGVGDLYTDPQIHTLNGRDFGKGNLGRQGFQKFLASHRCNDICRYLKLQLINPKKDGHGTMVPWLMPLEAIKSQPFQSRHYYEHSPMLRKFVEQCRREEEALKNTKKKTRNVEQGQQEESKSSSWMSRLFCACF